MDLKVRETFTLYQDNIFMDIFLLAQLQRKNIKDYESQKFNYTIVKIYSISKASLTIGMIIISRKQSMAILS